MSVVGAVLERAAAHIETYGLFKGNPGHGDGDVVTAPACVIGAIGLSAPTEVEASAARDAVRAFMHLDEKSSSIPEWSDAPETTVTEVVEALRAAARETALVAS